MEKELKELERLVKRNDGILQPQDVVDYARNENTALHKHFLWDDTEAAEQYRLQQARQLIRVTVTMLPSGKEEDQPVRAYVSLKSDRYGDGGYRAIATVLSDKEMREQLLQDALSELITFKAKYAMLQELSKVFDAIQAIPVKQKALPLPKKEVKHDHRRKNSPHLHV